MSVTGKQKKTLAHASPVEMARLTRIDYARATIKGGDLDIVIAKPSQISVAMTASYAAQFLSQLRSAQQLLHGARRGRGECFKVSIDCPIDVIIDVTTLEALISKLDDEVGVDPTSSHRR